MTSLPQQLKEVHHDGFHWSPRARRPFAFGPGGVTHTRGGPEMQRFLALRDYPLRKRPATGELLMWLQVLSLAVGTYEEQFDENLGKLPYLGVLLKDHQDIADTGGGERF